MDVHRLLLSCLSVLLACGCTVSGPKDSTCEKSTTVNLGPLIGLIGMAVDGDDKDDYEHFFEDDQQCCNCRKCRH